MLHHDLEERAVEGRGRRLSACIPTAAGVAAAVVALLVGTLVAPFGTGAPAPAGAAAVTLPLGAVQTLYSQDLLARINAERAARNSAVQVIPGLAVDPGLASAAQAWSAHLAASGQVQDPSLTACGPAPTAGQLCVLAGNSGSSGNGFWPGDGSDGMARAYMNSTGHRQNMLNAGYNTVGIGVTCSGGQAWTVELFGYRYGDLGSALARQSAQNTVEGDPVPAGPSVAGTGTGVPVYCPGQVVGPGGQTTASGGQFAYPYAVPPVPGEPVLTPPVSAVGVAASGPSGYWVARSDGSVTAHGTAVSLGSMAGQPLAAPIAHIVATPDGGGYWLVGSDGGIFSFGDATFHGSMGGQHLNAPVIDMAPTPDGGGYWLVAADGGIFAFGDAGFAGSAGGMHLNAPMVAMAPTPGGGGYWLVGSDGGIFAFGAAGFDGSAGSFRLNAPIVGMAATPDGRGYWLAASDGGIFAFGAAPFDGSAGALALQGPITGMAADPDGSGYWLVGADAGIFAFGAPFEGAG